MRQAELLGLQWGDVDFERGLIFVRRSYHQRHGFDSTKTRRSQRAVHMSPGLVGILFSHKQSTGGQPGELVFATNGKPIPAASMVRDRFNPTLENAGLRRIRWHDLRHTYAAIMISSGENIRFVSQQMGHTSTRTTWDIYGHLLPEVSRGAGGPPGRARAGAESFIFAEENHEPG